MLTGTGRGTRAARVLMTHPDDMAGRQSSAERMSQTVQHTLHKEHSRQQNPLRYIDIIRRHGTLYRTMLMGTSGTSMVYCSWFHEFSVAKHVGWQTDRLLHWAGCKTIFYQALSDLWI